FADALRVGAIRGGCGLARAHDADDEAGHARDRNLGHPCGVCDSDEPRTPRNPADPAGQTRLCAAQALRQLAWLALGLEHAQWPATAGLSVMDSAVSEGLRAPRVSSESPGHNPRSVWHAVRRPPWWQTRDRRGRPFREPTTAAQ